MNCAPPAMESFAPSAAEPDRATLLRRLRARAELARRHLHEFVRFTSAGECPAHQMRLAEELEWVEATPGARLIVTEPPRHGKSWVATTRFPAWCLGRGHTGRGTIRRVAIAAYGAALANSFSASVRDLFTQNSFAQECFPLPLASTAEHQWRIHGQPANSPSCLAVGVGGPFTGHGADLLIVDDPVKTADEARSETYRERVWRWWRSVARTRLQPGGRAVVIMTRWHEDDLAGRLIEQGGWRLLHMPAIDDEGKALWPEAYPVEALEAIREDMGAREFEALFQGRPTPDKGEVWDRAWFAPTMYTGTPPWLPVVCTAWDTAFETGAENDFSAWCRAGIDALGVVWVLGAGHRRMQFPALMRAIEAGAGGGPEEPAVIERAASGRSAIQLGRELRRPVIGIDAIRDKRTRASAVTPMAEAGRVRLPSDQPWAETLLGELTGFPNARHDDLHDAFVHALTWLRSKAGALEGPRFGGIA